MANVRNVKNQMKSKASKGKIKIRSRAVAASDKFPSKLKPKPVKKKPVVVKAKTKKSKMKPALQKVARKIESALRTVKKRVQKMKPILPKRPQGLPEGANWLSPYLTVKNVQGAIDFYKNALGFTVRMTMPGPDGKIVHAELLNNDSLLMLGPESPEQNAMAPQSRPSITLYAYVPNVDETASSIERLGGKIERSPQDEFWGDRCCKAVDPEGYLWMVATHVKDVSPEEMHPPADSEPGI